MDTETDSHIHKTVYFSSAMVSMSSLLFGISLTVMGCMKSRVQEAWEVVMDKSTADRKWGTVSGNIFLGCLISNILINLIKPNKKKSLLLNNFIHAAGYVVFLYSQSFASMFIGRLIIGIASGITCAVVPVYIAFIAPPKHRGFLLSFHSLGIIAGITIGNILACLDTQGTWRFPLFIVLGLIGLNFLGLNYVMNILEGARSSSTSLLGLIKKDKATKSIFIAMVVHVAQHFCGVDYVTLFLVNIFSSYDHSRAIAIGVSFFSVLVTLVFTKYVDQVGRKPLIIMSPLLTGIATTMLAFDLYPMLATLLFTFGYNVGLSSIPWFITSEIFPQKYADPAGLLAVSLNWLSAYGTLTILYPLHMKYGNTVFLFYTSCMVLFVGLMSLMFNETKGKVPNFQ